MILRTDEGISGLGEATLESHDDSLLGCLRDLEPLIVGADPTRIGFLAQVLIRQRFWKGGVVKASAISAVELACWDILGKAAGKPVYELMGGAVRDRIRVYANGWSGGATDPVEIRDRAQRALEAGYAAFKFSLALPSWPVGDSGVVRKIAAAAEAVRDAVGPDAALCFDGHGRYDSSLAIRIGRELERFDLLFFEEPVQPEDEEGMVRVAASQPVPVAAGVVGDAAQLLVQIEVLCKQNCFFRFFHGLNISLSGKVFKCFMHDFIRIINDFGIVKCRFPGYSVCVSTETATTDSNGKEKTGGGE